MSELKPTIFLLHGDDHFGIMSFIEGMVGKMGDPTTAQMNISHLQIGIDSDGDIKSACLAIPFLSDRRLVILMGYEEEIKKMDAEAGRDSNAKKRKEEKIDKVLLFFGSIPQSTALVLVVEDEWMREKGRWTWKTLPDGHWLLNWVKNNKTSAYYHLSSLPRGRDMAVWITNHAKKLGGQISLTAAQLLASEIGNDTQLAHHELEKLITYVNRARAVELADVEALTPPTIKESVFEMADAIGRRDSQKALDVLHDLLTDSTSEELLGMIIRQFRLLIIVKEALGTAMSLTDMVGLVRLPAGIVEKYISQAKGYTLPELKNVYQHLLTLDISNKTSLMAADINLDTFIVSMTYQAVEA